MNLPPIIGICGYPKAGKSTVQKILADLYDVLPLDDGLPLREIAVNYLGLTHEQVTTQEGKTETVMINGTPWIVRDVLGQIGNAFEEKFGGDVIPLMAVNRFGLDRHTADMDCRKCRGDGVIRGRGFGVCPVCDGKGKVPGTGSIDRRNSVSFASVRRQQGWFWRQRGALVIEVRRPGAEMGAEFNAYDPSAAHIAIMNDGDLANLEQEVKHVVDWWDLNQWVESLDAPQERIEPKGDQPEHQD